MCESATLGTVLKEGLGLIEMGMENGVWNEVGNMGFGRVIGFRVLDERR